MCWILDFNNVLLLWTISAFVMQWTIFTYIHVSYYYFTLLIDCTRRYLNNFHMDKRDCWNIFLQCLNEINNCDEFYTHINRENYFTAKRQNYGWKKAKYDLIKYDLIKCDERNNTLANKKLTLAYTSGNDKNLIFQLCGDERLMRKHNYRMEYFLGGPHCNVCFFNCLIRKTEI